MFLQTSLNEVKGYTLDIIENFWLQNFNFAALEYMVSYLRMASRDCYGYIVLILLLLTGVLNIYLRGIDLSWKFLVISRYGKLVLLKLFLFLCVVAVSLFHDVQARKRLLNEEEKRKFRAMAKWSGRILLIVSLAMAYIGVVLSRGA